MGKEGVRERLEGGRGELEGGRGDRGELEEEWRREEWRRKG